MARNEDLEKRIGRLLIARIPGTALDAQTEAALKAGKIGGAVIFKENAENLEQLLGLMRSFIKASFHPPVMMIDQEGGAVQRLEHVISPLPSPMALAATGDPELLADVTTLGAKQLKALGFNCLLAPVLDVLTNPLNPVIATRALGDTPQKVSQLGSVMIKAIADAGIVAVGKHFPGHGSTSEDSHTDLAVNKADCESVWRTDLVPFRNCINELPAILTAHVWLSSVDQEPLPASLSPRITRGILRDYLGFQGLVMTDDMIMKAITSQYGLKEAVAMALEAGNDLLLVCSTIEETLAVHEYLVGEVTSGRLSEELINAALERTEKLFSQAPQVIPESKIEEFKKKLERDTKRSMLASVRAIAMLRGELPESRSGEWLVLVPRHPRYPLNITEHLNAQIKALKIKDLKFTEIRYPLDPTSENISELAAKTVERQVIYVTYRSLLNRGQ